MGEQHVRGRGRGTTQGGCTSRWSGAPPRYAAVGLTGDSCVARAGRLRTRRPQPLIARLWEMSATVSANLGPLLGRKGPDMKARISQGI